MHVCLWKPEDNLQELVFSSAVWVQGLNYSDQVYYM